MDELIPVEQSPVETRQATRLGEVPELYRQKHERLAVELALHIEDAGEIFSRYGYSDDQAAELCENPVFISLLKQTTQEVQTSGLSFKVKAGLIAGELLPYAHELATDPYVSSAVRLDSIKWVSKVAGFDVADKDAGKVGGGLTLSITFSGNQPQQILSTREPVTIENRE
jgi:hypothetical protein